MAGSSPRPLPGKGLFGWLGRQVGYVTRAIRHPVAPRGGPVDAGTSAQTIYRGKKVLEEQMPGNPEVMLRRTVIDEAIVRPENPSD